tara:strand:+ start:8605 stop:9024 length:420 start_codon:yes stop_codon:yes gene_type:complete
LIVFLLLIINFINQKGAPMLNKATFQKYVKKINDNIDKAQELRNKMALKSLISAGVFGLCYYVHGFDIVDWLMYIIQFFTVIYFIYTTAVAAVITYIEFMVISKVEAVSFGKGTTKFAVEQARDMAVDKARSFKTKKDS